MRVLFLFISFPKPSEGENLYTDLVEEFHRHGHEVYVATLEESAMYRSTYLETERGFSVLRIVAGKMSNVS
ncbi:MAG TPA: hypothetical protein PK411_15800, partial [Mesotoga infera]|nr:hypothetical protein [Mesotoga infera]